jgi:FkbM family methyltransferase
MRHSFFHTLGNVVWVARKEGSDAIPLLSTYSRLKAQELLFAGRKGDGARRTSVLGMPVTFFDYYWLLEMYEEIFLRKQYEFAADNREPSIVDCGSNIGLAILFFKRLFPRATVLGFEPDPKTFDVLMTNVRENELDDVRVLNLAVHDGRDELELYGDRKTPGSPQMSTRNERIAGTTTRVPATRLSDHIAGTVDFLKLDVEGAERIVIEDLEQAAKLELIRTMAIEYHHHLNAEEDALSAVLSALERSGFGYQLEARLAGAPGLQTRHFQNVLVHAYRKEPQRPAPSGGR